MDHQIVRRIALCCLFLIWDVTLAPAQVQVDVRLEKDLYLAGEPVIVVVDVRNVGDEAVGYSTCDGDVRLEVAGVERRVLPKMYFGIGGRCGVNHPPLLPPGQTTRFRYLLQEYDLKPGQYQLTVSGKAGVRWKYYSFSAPNLPAPPPPKHKETDPVPGALFERTLPLNIVDSTENQLRAVLAPLIADADAVDPERRVHARAAIVESAPPFLDSLIARFAAEDQFLSAIQALGRIGTASSRAHLKKLFDSSDGTRRSSIVLVLGGIAHRDDLRFFARVLQNASFDQTLRGYAAVALGHVGGDRAVRYLQDALSAVPPEVRPSIATGLGNTRSAAAVPVLIGMYGNNPAKSNVCGALETLTHRHWCDGTADDPAAKRRQWLRWWKENRSKMAVCPLAARC